MASVTDQFKHSTLPWVWDDPRSLAQVQQVAEALGNGILPGNTGSLFTPRTACLITADSDFSQQLRYLYFFYILLFAGRVFCMLFGHLLILLQICF